MTKTKPDHDPCADPDNHANDNDANKAPVAVTPAEGALPFDDARDLVLATSTQPPLPAVPDTRCCNSNATAVALGRSGSGALSSRTAAAGPSTRQRSSAATFASTPLTK